jgi:hypothetical protein
MFEETFASNSIPGRPDFVNTLVPNTGMASCSPGSSLPLPAENPVQGVIPPGRSSVRDKAKGASALTPYYSGSPHNYVHAPDCGGPPIGEPRLQLALSYFPAPFLHALYTHATALRWRWNSADLPEDLDGRVFDATIIYLYFLVRVGALSTTQAQDLSSVLPLLYQRWRASARFAYARSKQKRLSNLNQEVATHDLGFPKCEERHLISNVLAFLISRREQPEHAVAFVHFALGASSDQIARRISKLFRRRVSGAMVRQWARRQFPRIRRTLRQAAPGLFSIAVRKISTQ